MSLASVYETATQKHFDRKLTSQIVFSAPEFFKIYEGSDTRADGGRSFVWHPLYARRTLTWYPRYGGVTRVPIENYTQAELPHVRCIAHGMLDEGDVSENTGRAKVIELLAESLSTLKDDVVYGMAGKLWNGAGGLEPYGLQSAITTTDGTYATLAQGTYTWFAPKRVNASGNEFSLAYAAEARLGATHGNERPDLAVCDAAMWRKVYNVVVGTQRITTPATKNGKLLGSLGFEVIEIDGIPYVWSDNAPVGSASYGTSTTGSKGIITYLNTKEIKMSFVPGRKMKRTEWRNLEAQPDVIACDMINHFVLAVLKPRNMAVIYGLKEN